MLNAKDNKGYSPFVSVIIPFYNLGEYARPCMQSLLGQKYDNCEFICVNDGSTDNTLDILREYDSDKRVRILNKSNGGLSSARNFGLDSAYGDYITFIDGDDFVHPEYLSCLVAALDKRADSIVISPLRLVKYKENFDIKTGWSSNVGHFDLSRKSTYEKILYDELSVSACGKLIPKEAYDDVRFPIGKVSEEVAIIGKLIRKYSTFVITDQPLYGYVMRNGSIGHQKEYKYKELQDRFDALKELEKAIKLDYDLDSDELLRNAMQYRWGLRIVSMAFIYDSVIDDKGAASRMKLEAHAWLGKNIYEIVRNKRSSFAQRLRILLYTYAPDFYCWLYAVHLKISYNI